MGAGGAHTGVRRVPQGAGSGTHWGAGRVHGRRGCTHQGAGGTLGCGGCTHQGAEGTPGCRGWHALGCGRSPWVQGVSTHQGARSAQGCREWHTPGCGGSPGMQGASWGAGGGRTQAPAHARGTPPRSARGSAHTGICTHQGHPLSAGAHPGHTGVCPPQAGPGGGCWGTPGCASQPRGCPSPSLHRAHTSICCKPRTCPPLNKFPAPATSSPGQRGAGCAIHPSHGSHRRC